VDFLVEKARFSTKRYCRQDEKLSILYAATFEHSASSSPFLEPGIIAENDAHSDDFRSSVPVVHCSARVSTSRATGYSHIAAKVVRGMYVFGWRTSLNFI